MLLPAGLLGISAALATIQAVASPVDPGPKRISNVADRLREIRAGVSELDARDSKTDDSYTALLSEWPNFRVGWGNGGWGWRNGGWHNGGWRNGGWGNGGWGNGGGPWHNWHNFWHNW
jgi:hypothetical protein